MNQKILPNSVFAAGSWGLLAVAMVSLAGVSVEVYQRHLADPPVQQFNFGAAKQQGKDELVNLAGIINAHIFGTVPVIKKPADKPKVVEAPKTKLNLSLTGVITAPDPNKSRAMIEVQRGQTSVVLVGNQIGNTGAKLDAVFSDHILIEHRGALEKLVIERDFLKLDDLSATNAQTISALNINVAEFEALAEVNPEDLDISKLMPVAQPTQPKVEPDQQIEDPDEAAAQQEKAEELEEEKKRIEQAEKLRQQQMEAEQQTQGQQQQQLQQLQSDPSNSGTLKKI
ncbi:MAG: type II secretion system protein N [bacterium]